MASPSYPTPIVNRGKELVESGWNLTEAARIIARETGGKHTPSRASIRRWSDPDYAETERMQKVTGKPIGGPRRKAWRMRLDRMRELRDKVGLSFRAIADLMSHDFEEVELNAEQTERMLTGRMSETTIARLLWPQSNTPERSTT